jgi:hypothetical protein
MVIGGRWLGMSAPAELPDVRAHEPRSGAVGQMTTLAVAAAEDYTSSAMQPLKAHVHNGRLVLNEPTDLPEGEVIELVPLDEVLAHGGDYLDDDERVALHGELEISIAEADAGQLIDADEVLAELRAAR